MGNPGPRQEISLISYPAVLDISEIKLIRTDTTLDLSQKAEKVCRKVGRSHFLGIPAWDFPTDQSPGNKKGTQTDRQAQTPPSLLSSTLSSVNGVAALSRRFGAFACRGNIPGGKVRRQCPHTFAFLLVLLRPGNVRPAPWRAVTHLSGRRRRGDPATC